LDRVRQRTDEWLSLYEGPVNVDISDLQIEASGDVAFGHYLYRVTGTLMDGKKVDMWVRATGCYRKKDGKWKLVHEHQSVPFDPKTGKASLDLKP
jgi:ketosteroid isomerase-like protein